jgi:hypothetical protein
VVAQEGHNKFDSLAVPGCHLAAEVAWWLEGVVLGCSNKSAVCDSHLLLQQGVGPEATRDVCVVWCAAVVGARPAQEWCSDGGTTRGHNPQWCLT